MGNNNVRSVKITIITIYVVMFMFLTVFASVAQEQPDKIEPLNSDEVESKNGVEAETLNSETVESQNGIDVESEDSETVESQNSEDYESQMYELKTALYCYCGCDRMTYEICHCVTAEFMKKEFRKALNEGQTVEEIRAAYLEEHGPQYSAVMHAKGINLLAYIMPAVILFLIGGVAVVVLQNSRRDKVMTTPPETQISEEMQRQLESELEKYKDQN